jgi:hypothetical protein
MMNLSRAIALVLLVLLLSGLACATFRKPGDPAPTRPPTETLRPIVVLSPEPTLTTTPTSAFTPSDNNSTEQ